MINKVKLQSIINKYYLNGLIEKVRWTIKDDVIYVNFVSPSSDIVGSIEGKGFTIKDATVAIYDTTRLLRLLSVTNQDLFVDLIKKGGTFTKLTIEDNQFNLFYSLADLHLVKLPPEVTEPDYNIIINLTNDDILALIKAKTALVDTKDVIFKLEESIVGDKEVEITFGEDSDHSDKISYVCKDIVTELNSTNKITYDADKIKEILYCNREFKNAKINLSLEGLMKIEFEDENIKSTYFIVQKENE